MNRPTIKTWIAMGVFCICACGFSASHMHEELPLKSSTQGDLDPNYTVETESNYGFETGRSYECGYTFSVAGRSYHGTDRIYTQPTAQTVSVYFNSQNPEENALTPLWFNQRARELGMVLILACFLCYWAFPTDPIFPLPADTAEGEPSANTGFGDAAKEYLRMPLENYSGHAPQYVMVGFGIQVVLMSWIGSMSLIAVAGSHARPDIITGLVTLAVSIYTLWMYWDRFMCIAIYSGKYCSGCMNISVLYVPIISMLYAIRRGILKLSGE